MKFNPFKDKAIFTIQSSVKIICVDEDNVECTVIIDIDIFYLIDSLSNFTENIRFFAKSHTDLFHAIMFMCSNKHF